jgi:hypothetical protein
MQMLIRLMLERDPLKRPLAAQVLSYLSKSSILTAQIPEFSSHIRLHCSIQSKKVVRYNGNGGP